MFGELICEPWKLTSLHPKSSKDYNFLFYKDIFYKNMEAEICEILRIF